MKLEKKNKNLQISIIMSIFAKRNHQNIKIMTKEELIDRINDIEWEDFEAKEAKSELPKNIWETVSAFANTSGGWIVLGIKQNGKKFEISGVDNAEKLEQDFLGTLRSQKFNEPVDAKSMLYHIDGHRVLAFHIASSPHKPIYYNNPQNTFIRFGSGDQRATNGEITAMFHNQSFGIKSEQILLAHIAAAFGEKLKDS